MICMAAFIPRRRALGALVIASPAALPAGPIHAGDPQEPPNGLRIENACAVAAEAGGSIRLSFNIDNASDRTIIVRAMRSEAARQAALKVRSGESGMEATAGLVAENQEALKLDRTHLIAELAGLRHDLGPDDIVAFEVIFDEGAAPDLEHIVEAPK
jgi:hypothetical protein